MHETLCGVFILLFMAVYLAFLVAIVVGARKLRVRSVLKKANVLASASAATRTDAELENPKPSFGPRALRG